MLLQGIDNLLCDIILDMEELIKVFIVPASKDYIAVFSLNKLYGDAYFFAIGTKAALYQVVCRGLSELFGFWYDA